MLTPLPDLLLRPLIEAALREDLGRAGDITSDAIVPQNLRWEAVLAARQGGIVAGLDLARLAFHGLDPSIAFEVKIGDGQPVKPGDVLAKVMGPARALLSAERVALNYLCHLSGIATATGRLVEAVKGHKARICCTRKTTPGLRAVEKYAVRAGGGSNHRFGLDDAVLIKDNHIAVAGGVAAAVTKARQAAGHLVKLELEVDTLAQLQEALALPGGMMPDAVLLDNIAPDILRQAVQMVGGRCITEASGRVTAETAAQIAATGVDIISAGWITHSAPILDIGLDAA
jgi:nicotinate-nucleotide pyrophosphorylase (carboxylating)